MAEKIMKINPVYKVVVGVDEPECALYYSPIDYVYFLKKICSTAV
jgi:hypothetical protein